MSPTCVYHIRASIIGFPFWLYSFSVSICVRYSSISASTCRGWVVAVARNFLCYEPEILMLTYVLPCSLLNSWVMLSDNEGFVSLPGERILYSSPPRTTLSLQSQSSYPGTEPLSISSNAGCVHLTNQRVCTFCSSGILGSEGLTDSTFKDNIPT